MSFFFLSNFDEKPPAVMPIFGLKHLYVETTLYYRPKKSIGGIFPNINEK